MTPEIRWLALALIVGSGWNAHAAQAQDRTHDITIEDYFTQASITDCVLSPDGSQVAYTESRWQGPKEPASSDLWIVNCQTQAIQRLTRINRG